MRYNSTVPLIQAADDSSGFALEMPVPTMSTSRVIPPSADPASSRFSKIPASTVHPIAAILKARELMIGQTANILQYLGPRLGLVPKDQASRLWVHQLQLTVTDWVAEVGNTHHPIANVLYYEEQKDEAKNALHFLHPSACRSFSATTKRFLQRTAKPASYCSANKICYADLSLFQMVEGLRYAFPRAMAKMEPTIPAPSPCTTASPPGRGLRNIWLAAPSGVQHQRHLSATIRSWMSSLWGIREYCHLECG